MILQQVLPSLTHSEKIELLAQLKAMIADELAHVGGDPQTCPRCGSASFVKKGKGPDKSQRWLCRVCRTTFSIKTMGLLSRSKLGAGVWMEFAECMVDALSLRDTACRCGVSLYTAWFMRMRVCEIMAYRLLPARPGTFQVDDTHFVVNLSGNHGRSAGYEMPRKAHQNGSNGRRAGGSKTKNRASVACGINEYGDCFCELAGTGATRASVAGLVVADKLPPGSAVTVDGDLSYISALKSASYPTTVVGEPVPGNINMVNALHSRLKGFMARFHGVSTRRLQRYLDWFCWREQYKRSDADKRSLLFSHEAEGRYVYTRELTHLEDRPYLPYWDRRRYASFTRHMSIMV